MYKPQKLHPISYLTGVIQAIKENIILVIIFLIFNLKNFDFTDFKSYIYPGIVALIFIISFLFRAVKVYNTRYWIEDDHFILDTGVFTKERKELNIRRIQSMDTSQSLINQIVGGVKIQIKTPSDGIDLETVSKQQSTLIQSELRQAQQNLLANHQEIEQNEPTQQHVSDSKQQTSHQQLYKLSFKELLLMALTSGAIGVAFATLSPIIGSLSDKLPWEWLNSELSQISQAIFVIVLIIVGIILLLSYIVGTIIVIFKNFNYTVTESDQQLNISYGLFNVKNITVPINRVQAVVEKQSFLRKMFGYTSIHFTITSDMDDFDKDDVTLNGNVTVLPFIKQQKAYEIIKPLMPNMKFQSVQQGMPWSGYHRYFWIQSLILLISSIIVAYFWQVWPVYLALFIIAILALHSIIVIKKSGYTLDGDELVIKNTKLFGFKTTYFKHDKLLGMELKRNPFLARKQLMNFVFIIAKASGKQEIGLKYNKQGHVEALKEWYLRREEHESI